MVTGEVPFEGETTSDIIAAIIKDNPEPMSLTVPDLPQEFEEVVGRALAKDLNLRYQTIEEFSLALHRLKDEMQLHALVRSNSDGAQLSAAARNLQITRSPVSSSTTRQVQQKTDPLITNTARKWIVFLALVFLLTGTVATIVSFTRRKTPTTVRVVQTPRQLTNRDGFVSASRFAPDGKGVIYSAGFDGKPVELFFTDVEGSETRSAGIQPAALKSVSRTGKIAVLLNFELNWADGYNGTLAVLPQVGGKPEVVMEGVDDAAFGPDGNTLAIVRSVMGEQQLEYPAGTVLYKSSGWMSYPRFSPKGDKIAFFEHPLGDFSGNIVVFDLVSRKKTDVSTAWKSLKGLAWNPKNDEIWFGGSKEGKKLSVNAVSLGGQLQTNLYDVPGIGARIEDISGDGKILINQGSNHATMMVLAGKSVSEVNSQFAWSTSADLSADGKTLLYYDWGWERTDSPEMNSVYLRRLNGSERIQLGPGKALALSPDGNWALALQATPQPRLVLFSTSHTETKTLPNQAIKEYHYASFFPDSQHILFTGMEARQDAAIRSYVQDINTGEVHALTEEWTTALRVSPDGKSVITLQPDTTYYIQPLNGEAAKPIPGLESGDEPIQWSDDGRAVYVIGSGEFATKIYRVDLATGNRREWKTIDPPNKVGLVGLETNQGGILITPDGKVSVYTYWILLQHLVAKSID
jgi:Tol biopolymer transport system component